MLMGMVEGTAPTVVASTGGGGGGSSVASIFGLAVDNGFSGTYTSSTISFPSGFVAVAIWIDFGGPIGSSAMTISGQSVTSLSSTIGQFQTFGATVSSAGTISINTGILGCFSMCGWSLTGLSSTTPTAVSGYTTNQADPQGPVSLTVNSGGVGVVAMGSQFGGQTGKFPVTWTQATRDSNTEASVNTGNTACIGGAHESSAGTYSIQSSGSSQSWQGCNIVALAFA